MTLYELNQAGYAASSKLSKSKIAEKQAALSEWIRNIERARRYDENIYFMLLSPYDGTTHYYTLFAWTVESMKTGAGVAAEVLDIVKDLGTLKGIEFNDGHSWEFWVTGSDAVTRMYALFDYTEGVVEI